MYYSIWRQMQYWNYRVIRNDLPSEDKIRFGLYEVFFNENGEAEFWDESPIISGESFDDIKIQIGEMLIDMLRYPEVLSLADLMKKAKK
jgi:hypothetical protein